ncbi:hypothetical protein ABIA96_003628 [Bradyrhizobium sp. LB11.1]
MLKGNEPFGGAQRRQGSARGPSRRQSHRERCREHRDDGLIAGRSRVRDRFMEVAAEIIIATDAVAADESLGRRIKAFAPHEGVHLGSTLELVILNFESLSLQEIKRLQAERADVLRRHHSV